ncbi:MAG: dethiobiotin synthase [Clostridiales bacterium]|nr:dethiobiotin synthase [Clostridiales bacterium]
MNERTGKGIFVTATGTDVGKTYVSARIVRYLRQRGVRAGYFKAALSGAEERDGRLIPGDAAYVCRQGGLSADPAGLVPFVYRAPLSPHLAARLENRPVSMEEIRAALRRAAASYDFVVAEGSGGIVCPLRYEQGRPERTVLLADVIRMTGFPLLIVADAGLGTINHTVLTAAYARSQGLFLRGVVLNRFRPGDLMHEDNRKMIEDLAGLPVLACLPSEEKE